MKKKYVVIVLYSIYVLFLFVMATYYQYLDELPAGPGFFSGFGRSLEYARNFFLCCLFSSWAFFIVLYLAYRRIGIAFIFYIPFLLFLVGLIVFVAADFILWISQLRPLISEFQKAFLITSISSTLLMVWFFGEVFKKKEPTRTLTM